MKVRTMGLRKHFQLFIIVSIAWLLFWVAGLPDYYQQYSSTSMVIFDLAVLPPIWFLVYRNAKHSRPGNGGKVCLWWAFYISVPLFIYDLIYCGLYLGHGATFLTKYWYLTVYYILPWIIFPPTGWFIDKKSKLAMWETAEQQERTMCYSDFQGAGAGDPMWHKFVAPYRKTLDMGNYTMHYIDIGHGEPVVMVHGMMLSTYSWRNNIQALLDADFRVILVDVPGHGRTDIPPEPYPYTVEQIASDIVTLTNKLGLEHFNLIGHSLGAGVTLYTSFHYPQHVRKAIVIDPPAFGPPRRLILTYPGMTAVASAIFGRWTVKLGMKAMYYDDSLVVKELIDEYTRPTLKDGFWNMYSALSHQYFSSKFYQMQSDYHSTAMPLCIIWGEQDEWLPVEIAPKLHERIPNSRLVTIPDSGHNPHEECPERVNPVIVEFLTKHD